MEKHMRILAIFLITIILPAWADIENVAPSFESVGPAYVEPSYKSDDETVKEESSSYEDEDAQKQEHQYTRSHSAQPSVQVMMPCDEAPASTFSTTVDFLYWRASSIGFVPANQTYLIPEPFAPATVHKAERLKEHYKPGFRIALGWNFDGDDWDLEGIWTYYSNNSVRNRQMDVNLAHSGNGNGFNGSEGFFAYWVPYVDSSLAAENEQGVQKFLNYSTKWRLLLNEIDLVLSKDYSLMKGFAFKPQMGLKTAWIKQYFSSDFLNNPVNPGSFLVITHFERALKAKNHFWGIGPSAGITSDWELMSGVGLLGNLSTSLLYGRTKMKNETATKNNLPNANFFDDFYHLSPNLQMGLGLSWSTCSTKERWRVFCSVLWETNLWWNQFHLLSTATGQGTVNADQIIQNPVQMNQPLITEGITANIRLDF